MQYKLHDIINIKDLKNILIKINDTYNFTIAIIDNDKEIITTSKWQKFILELDQNNKKYSKEFEKNIQEIIEIIDYKVPSTLINRCFQGISYIAHPLIIRRKNYGYILAGQFFLKKPDLEVYKNLANEYGFEESNYLKKISKIPVITKKEIEDHLSFIHEYIEMSINNNKLIHRNKTSSFVDFMDGNEIKDALIASEGRFKKLVESITDYIYTVRIEKGKEISTSHGPGCITVTGYTSEEYDEDPYLWYQMVFEEDRDAVLKQASMMINGKQASSLEHRIIHKNGAIKWVRNTPVLRYNEGHAIIGYDGLIVDITERKQAEEALKKSAEQYYLITNTVLDGFKVIDLNGRLIEVNDAYCDMLGFCRDELLKMSIQDIDAEMSLDEIKTHLRNIINSGSDRFETKHRCKDGRIIDVEISMTFFSQSGHILGFIQDITERKRAEEALEKSAAQYHFITNTAMDGFAVVDLNGRIIDANDAYCQMLGYSKTELVKMSVPEIEITDNIDAVKERIKKIIKYDSDRFETKHRCKNGRIIDIETSMSYFKASNQILVFLRNITERKLAEEALNESEEKFMKAFQSTNVLMALSTIDNGKYIEVNESFLTTMGYTREEVIGRTSKDLNIFVDFEQRSRVIKIMQEKGYARNVEVPIITRNKEIRVGLFSADIISLKKEKYLLTVMTDITDRKRLEEILEKDKDELKQIIDSSPIIVFYKDKEGKFIRVNKAYAEELKIPEEKFIGKTVFDFYSSKIAESMDDDDKEVLRTKKPKINIIKQYESAAGLKWSRSDKIPILDKNGNPTGLIGFAQDITEWKMAEESLRESETKYRALVENSLLGIGISQGDKIIYANKALMNMFGYDDLEEFISKPFVEYLTPESKAYVHEWRKRKANGEKISMEMIHEVIRKDGEIRTLRLSIMYIIINNINCSYTTFMDITEQKKAEEALIIKENTIASSINSIVLADFNVNITYVNPAFLKLWGYENENEVIGTSIFNYVESEMKVREVMKILLKKYTFFGEFDAKKKDGSLFTVQVSASIVKDKLGNPICIMGSFLDITKNKQAEEALRESEERFRTAFENANVGVCLVDINGNIFKANNMISKILGYSKDEIEKMDVNSISYTDDKELSPVFMKNAILGKNDNVTFDKRYIHKDGHIVWGHLSSSIVRNSQGEPLYFISHIRDITERKKAEESLQASESRYKALIESQADLISRYTPDTILTFVNDSYCEFFGKKREELIGKSYMFMIAPEFHEKVRKETKDLIKNPRLLIGEYLNYRYDGKECWIQWIVQCIKDEQGKVIELQAVGRDLTERKLTEEELLLTQFSVDKASIGITRISENGKIEAANEEMYRNLGYTHEELCSMFIFDLEPSLSMQQFQKRIKEAQKKDLKTVETKYLRKDGSQFSVEVTLSYLDYKGKSIIVSFTRDITERKKAEDDLQYSKEYAERLIQTANAMIICLNVKGNITVFNEAAEKITGYKKSELTDKNWFETLVPKEKFPQVWEMFNKLPSGELFKYYENPILTKDGEERFISWQNSELIERGEIIGTISFGIDITEKKKAEEALIKFNEELEKRVQQRTEELINVNKELESFSYTVSHDLRAPLRSINGFSQILMDDYKDKLDEEALNYLKRIINSSNKLAELIDHLLNLSRITRSEVHKVKVDLSKMANDIIIELKDLNPERNVDFICKQVIVVDADYTLIHSAIYNIIQNAWKYTSKKTKARIEFGETKDSGNRVFYIKDNGAGFDMKYSDKLFKVFQRLHSEREFEGTGIGLSTVNHIINKHEGKIWAESGINKGTTIYFTLG